MLEEIAEKGANLNMIDEKNYGRSYFGLLCGKQPGNENLPFIAAMIDNGADVNLKDKGEKWRPMYYAAMYHNKWVIKLLLERGADPNPSDKFGRIPVHFLAGDIYSDAEDLEEILECIQMLTRFIKTGNIQKEVDLHDEEDMIFKKRIDELEARLEEKDQEEDEIINDAIKKRKKQ